MDFGELKSWATRKRITKLINKLENNGFQARFYSNIQKGVKELAKTIPSDAQVGIGGSVTVRELGLINILKSKSCTVIEHWAKSEEEDETSRRKANLSQYYISGTNAITESGCLVNIDGIGNRVAALAYGPKYVFIVAGINKIVKDIDSAIWRIKNIAAPANARRVGVNTPCAQSGYCSDCSVRERICRAILILERAPIRTHYRIFIFNKSLGF